MLTYEKFKEVMIEQLGKYLPGGRESYEIREEKFRKINTVEDKLTIRRINPEHNLSPAINFESLYHQFQMNHNFQQVLMSTAEMVSDVFKSHPARTNVNYEKLREEVIFEVINAERNRELLKEVPHREYLDLAIVYRWPIKDLENERGSVLIRNDMAEHMNITEEQLYQHAYENTRSLYPILIADILDAAFKTPEDREEFERMAEDDGVELVLPDKMMVLTNTRKEYGAAVMLYEDVLYELAEQMGSDLYILPSSRHEVIAVLSEMSEISELVEMVSTINEDLVSSDQFLSNNVYHYDKDLRTLNIVDTSPNRELEMKNVRTACAR